MLNVPLIIQNKARHVFFFTMLLFIATTATAQSVLQEKDKRVQSLLNHHNAKRRDVGVQPLVWNNVLATYAQEWANYLAQKNKCIIKHRPEKMRKGKEYGENIYWASSYDDDALLAASESWYSEIKLYDNKPLSISNVNAVGHYTQMVWHSTTQIGVGMAVCPSGALIVVANYQEAGNMIGEKPY
ncbi:MAG: CAP family protein [Ferruginibacter sp.]